MLDAEQVTVTLVVVVGGKVDVTVGGAVVAVGPVTSPTVHADARTRVPTTAIVLPITNLSVAHRANHRTMHPNTRYE